MALALRGNSLILFSLDLVLKRIVRGLVVIVCMLLITATVAVYSLSIFYGWRGGNAFVDSINQGWFAFVLVRTVALFLIVVAVRCLWRFYRGIAVAIAALLIAGVITFSLVKMYSPTGIYSFTFEEIEYVGGDHYCSVADGKLEDVHRDQHFHFGRYYKSGNDWIVAMDRPSHIFVFKLKFSVFGIRMTNIEDPKESMFYPRRIIPFVRPHWMPNWLQ